MILFVFEGTEREPTLFRTLEYLFFPKDNQNIICSFGNNIYNLYKRINGKDGFSEDLVSVLRQDSQNKPNNQLKDFSKTSDFSEVFLFFDYDCHNQNKTNTLTPSDLNRQLEELFSFFNDETDNGKLYINYPMIESIRYTKQLPDSDYSSYTMPVTESCDFKTKANEFSFYKNFDFIEFRSGRRSKELRIPAKERIEEIRNNWDLLKVQNVQKAHLICTGNKDIPVHKDAVEQQKIFGSQLQKYVNVNNTVAVLNAFPLFLYEYFT